MYRSLVQKVLRKSLTEGRWKGRTVGLFLIHRRRHQEVLVGLNRWYCEQCNLTLTDKRRYDGVHLTFKTLLDMIWIKWKYRRSGLYLGSWIVLESLTNTLFSFHKHTPFFNRSYGSTSKGVVTCRTRDDPPHSLYSFTPTRVQGVCLQVFIQSLMMWYIVKVGRQVGR